jgi:hypothetical protein
MTHQNDNLALRAFRVFWRWVGTMTGVALLFTLPVLSQQPEKATFRGVVRRVGTDEAIPGARVTVSSVGASQSPVASAVTDEEGEFSITGIDRGAYPFSVVRNGYIRYENLAVVPQSQDGFVVHLKKTATVRGRVSVARGRPLPGIRVKLLRRVYDSDGRSRLATAVTVETNDLGEYRAYWVTPGRYYLSAGTLFVPGFTGDIGMRDHYPETFFPGSIDVSQARAIDLEEGADIRAIDFSLVRQERFYSVRGRVIDGATGQTAGNATVFLGGLSISRWYDPATGTFELPNMPPGRHRIMARLGDPKDPRWPHMVATTVTLVDSGIDNLVLTVSPPMIEGQIRAEGPVPVNTALVMSVSLVPVATVPVDLELPQGRSAVSAPDGAFRTGVPVDGAYRVKVSGLPANFYVKEARFNDADVLPSGARFSTSGRLNILISAGAGEVSGRVLNDRMESARRAEVVLVPSEFRDRSELFSRTTAASGQFRFQGVAPGDYRIFAWEGIEENAFFDAEVLKRFEHRGAPVHIGKSSRETIDVRLIPETVAP